MYIFVHWGLGDVRGVLDGSSVDIGFYAANEKSFFPTI